ncbi:MAG: phytanoyl-CoA dioxygenase family protein [Flavobacteriaceae bacterium]
MTAVTAEDLRNMKPLRDANATVGDAAQTLEMMEEDGYVFFRNVLDQGAVGRLRQRFLDVLVDWGYVDADSIEPIWNGKDLTAFPVKIEPLHDDRVWEEFVADPAIDAFFTKLLGAPPFWLEITEYRITPPGETLPADPFIGRHQDAFYNMGMECFTCWIPLMEIDESIGGLAVLPGLHKGDFFHNRNDPPQYRIPPGALPNNWHRSLYRPGDMVMFHKMLPHSGLPNTSDRFRMSMDIRVAPMTGELPIIGEILRFTNSEIVVRESTGKETRLVIDADTYSRWTGGKRISTAELREFLPVGSRVLASSRDGRAISLRPPR